MIKNGTLSMQYYKWTFVLGVLIGHTMIILTFCYPWLNYKSLLTTNMLLKVIKLGDKELFMFFYINTNFPSHHRQLPIRPTIVSGQGNLVPQTV